MKKPTEHEMIIVAIDQGRSALTSLAVYDQRLQLPHLDCARMEARAFLRQLTKIARKKRASG